MDAVFDNPVFCLFTQIERKSLLRGAKVLDFYTPQEVFFQGDYIDYYYFVICGAVKVYRLDIHGDEHVMNVLSAGEFVAHIANMLHPRHYPVTVSALKHTQLLRLNADAFVDAVKDNHAVALALMAEMGERIFKQVSYIDTLKNNSAIERIKAFLLTAEGDVVNNEKHIVLHSTKRVLAQQLSLTPECLSRCLNTLKKQRVLTVTNTGFIVHNMDTIAEQYI